MKAAMKLLNVCFNGTQPQLPLITRGVAKTNDTVKRERSVCLSLTHRVPSTFLMLHLFFLVSYMLVYF